ncbi:hypothetical protein [Hyphomonas johnsonii]|jgi:hypothetical protein|uniref:Uncharacterized protein n=1 Tax=Hyphomonas johnsonii MHS-2 TaxID=1280950 RepID=A0A059FNU3_9PROT|nr:hypothetical protein [Hyphomonas johnsonii]KCZ92191.1 hypothetical protein HJO_09154 [Hyphomonas johnsonii MHS-2]
MSQAYPLAATVKDALKPGVKAARTRAEAEELAGALVVESLHTEWLSLSDADATEQMAANSGGVAHGFLQRYEDDKGAPVLAVTFWRLVKAAKAKKPAPAKAAKPAPEGDDHTDDLYFRSGRTKPSRKRFVDPRQMDLFETPPEA